MTDGRRTIAALAVTLLLPAPAFALPDGTAPGPHAVGIVTRTFVKPSETTGAPRQLDTIIWYPAVEGTGTAEGSVFREATILRRRWPLVMFSHGSCSFPAQSSFFTARLASFGFVVAAPPHPGNTIAEYPQCQEPAMFADSFANRVADVRFVIDQLLTPGGPFASVLNGRRIGMSGHSFGGQTTLRVVAADRRIRGGVSMAPVVAGIEDLRIDTPTIVLGAELDTLTPFETDVRDSFGLLQGPRFLVELLNTGHCAFAIGCVPAACGPGCDPTNLPQAETQRITMRYGIPFFLRYVAGKGRFGKLLRARSAPPNVLVLEAHPRVKTRSGQAVKSAS
jgi:predicted dienelactone hydrolase